MKHIPHRLLAVCVASTALFSAHANITSWLDDGRVKVDIQNAPVDFEESIAWKTPLQETSNATPILVDGKLFFCEEPATLICADANTGEVLWKKTNSYPDVHDYSEEDRKRIAALSEEIRVTDVAFRYLKNQLKRIKRSKGDNTAAIAQKEDEIAKAETQLETLKKDPYYNRSILPETHHTNGYSSYTPTSDGTYVYASFGLGIVVCYDLDGNRIWASAMDTPDNRFGGSTKPRLVDGKLIVRFTDLSALDPKTGEAIWTIPSTSYFGTPTAFTVENKTLLFTPNGLIIDPDDGNILQSGLVRISERREWALFNTPMIENGAIYVVNGHNDIGYAHAFRIPKNMDTFRKSGMEEIWGASIHATRYYASPLIHEGLMYCFSDDRILTVLRADSGEVVYSHTIEGAKGEAYPSVVMAGGNIYLGIDDGILIVIEPGSEYKEIARHAVSPGRSTLIFTEEYAYLRAYDSIQAFVSQN